MVDTSSPVLQNNICQPDVFYASLKNKLQSNLDNSDLKENKNKFGLCIFRVTYLKQTLKTLQGALK